MKQLENGYVDHGVVTNNSNHRGTVVTVDGDGRDVVLVWLHDHRGGYALLMVDAETGAHSEIARPFHTYNTPFTSLLSSKNRYYTHFGSHFLEFDPAEKRFTFVRETSLVGSMAMGMTEDDQGRIWGAIYPDSSLFSFDPETGAFCEYEAVNSENWPQYQRYVAADDANWIYIAIGNTASQIIGFNPEDGETQALLQKDERGLGTAFLYRDLNGRVYGTPLHEKDGNWYEFHAGKRERVEKPDLATAKPIITGPQSIFHARFPSGRILKECNLVDRFLLIEDPGVGGCRTVAFEYESEGPNMMGVTVGPDNKICGGTMFPMRFFRYDPQTESMEDVRAFCQFNTMIAQGDRLFIGGYCGGFLLEYDPAKPMVETEKGNPLSNPLFLTECEPVINRPHKLFAHPDGKTIIMAGTPGYGYTGGGLLFWDRETRTRTLLEHTAIIPQHSTVSMVALSNGDLLCGSTTIPGQGGEKKAVQAELYIMDMKTKQVTWHQAVLPDVGGFTDLCLSPHGLLYGMADLNQFFVFDINRKEILSVTDTTATFGPVHDQQGPRKFIIDAGGNVYILFRKGIVKIQPETFELVMHAESPVELHFGGDILNDRIWFGHASHLCSYRV